MKVGEYTRLNGEIHKITKIEFDEDTLVYDVWFEDTDYGIFTEKLKSSPNIIDLIEVGDYVNGMEVTRIDGTRWDENDLHCYCEHNGDENWKQAMIPAKDIKSIVTKEQFESMEYKVKE